MFLLFGDVCVDSWNCSWLLPGGKEKDGCWCRHEPFRCGAVPPGEAARGLWRNGAGIVLPKQDCVQHGPRHAPEGIHVLPVGLKALIFRLGCKTAIWRFVLNPCA